MVNLKELSLKPYSYPQSIWLSYYRQEDFYATRPDPNPHRHQYYELLFFKQASNCKHVLDFTAFDVPPRMVFFIQPRHIHFVDSLAPNCQYELYVITFSEDFLSAVATDPGYLDVYNKLFTNAMLQVNASVAAFLEDLWRQIRQEIASQDLGYEQVIINLFRTLLIKLNRQLAQSGYTLGDKPLNQQLYLAFQRLLDEYWHQHWSVEQYANALQLTTRQLHRICKKVKDCSPQTLIHERLNLEAKRHLFYLKVSIKEVAFRLGFTDQAYFSRFFTRMNSVSPETFRIKMSQKYHTLSTPAID